MKRTLEERGLAVEVVPGEVYDRVLAAETGVSDRSVSVTATTTPARGRSVGIVGALGAAAADDDDTSSVQRRSARAPTASRGRRRPGPTAPTAGMLELE